MYKHPIITKHGSQFKIWTCNKCKESVKFDNTIPLDVVKAYSYIHKCEVDKTDES